MFILREILLYTDFSNYSWDKDIFEKIYIFL